MAAFRLLASCLRSTSSVPAGLATPFMVSGTRYQSRRARHAFGHCKHFVTRVGDQHGVLPLGGKAVVARDDGPAIGQCANFLASGIDHGLDGKYHAGLKADACARLAIMQYLGILMELSADPVPAIFADH